MNHRNTLNTRLLPLSILISSLVSGGAMAASTSTLTPDATLGMGNGGSFIVTTNTKAPEDILLESLFPEDQSITAEMITQAKSQIATMQQNHQKQTQDIEASIANLTAAQQKIAQKELDSFKDIFEKKSIS
ncbi:hypothetical protein ACNSPB_12605 [Yersinia enterocolitica]